MDSVVLPAWFHHHWFLFAGVFFLSALLCGLITGGVAKLAAKYGITARRDARRRHERVTPLLGGIGFYCVLVPVTMVLAFTHTVDFRFAAYFIAALTCIFGVGLLDDYFELKAPPKFFAQVLASLLIILSSPELPPVLADIGLPKFVVQIGLIIWIVGVTNATNMIDGLDGLCSGIVGISALTLSFISIGAGAPSVYHVYLALALAGCCLGFLRHNFNPAKIFLGDSGSLVLGFVLAVISVKIEAKRSLFVSISLPILLLGLPILDTALSVIRRKLKGRSVLQGDRGHLHHRLKQLGLSHRATVFLLWSISAYMNLTALLLSRIPAAYSFYVYFAVLPLVAFAIGVLYFIERRLSVQTAQFGHLFLKEKETLFSDRKAFLDHLGKLNRASVILFLDTSDFLKEIAHERPARIVEFYLNLYSIIRSHSAQAEMTARISEHQTAILFAHIGENRGEYESQIFPLLQRVRELQQRFGIFQTHDKDPEGVTLLNYPRDSLQLAHLLGLDFIETSDDLAIPKVKSVA